MMTKQKNNSINNLHKYLKYVQNSTNSILSQLYTNNNKFMNAINYSLINSGKKYRPFLLWASGTSLGVNEEQCFKVGAALEMIHTYSLIHDDLPSMDNDSSRHGKPSLHKEYGENIAILAGDGILTDAFEFLSNDNNIMTPNISLKIINTISSYLGSSGMVFGQALEMFSNSSYKLTLEDIRNIHYLKTAKFMEVAVLLGGVLSNAPLEIKNKLILFGKNIGLAFQVCDDIEDFADDNHKVNICNFIPITTLKKEIENLVEEAVATLKTSNNDFDKLISFANFLKSNIHQ